jgi:phosphohistidine phosphatase
MKKVFFIRHAKASWKNSQTDDFDRPLNKRGRKDAFLIANRLKEFGIKPDIILTSPAIRAQKTAKIISKILEKEYILVEDLYQSSLEGYLELISNIPDKHETIFIIAHNPEITLVCEYLTDLILGTIPTSGIAAVKLNCSSYSQIGEGCAKLLFFDYPKKHLKKT